MKLKLLWDKSLPEPEVTVASAPEDDGATVHLGGAPIGGGVDLRLYGEGGHIEGTGALCAHMLTRGI